MANNSIGNLLNESIKQNIIASAIHEGEVFRMHLGESESVKGKNIEDDGRNKYFIVLGHDAEGNAVGLVLINTHIHPALPPKRKEMHYRLDASKYPFLNGVSRYADCSDFKIISRSKFAALFDSQKSKGQIDDEDLSLIKTAVASYEDASPKLMKRFGLI